MKAQKEALDGGGLLTSRSGRFTPEKDRVPILKEDEWASMPVWVGAENLILTRIRSPIVHSVTIRYTDWAIPAHYLY